MHGPVFNLRHLYAPTRNRTASRNGFSAALATSDCPNSQGTANMASETASGATMGTVAASAELRERQARDVRLEESMLALERRFEETFARDTVRDQLFSKLHDEVQEHKRGLLQALQRPYIMGLVQLHDASGRTAEHLLSKGGTFSAAEAAQLVLDFRDDVELLMQHNGIEAFQEQGSAFVPARQTSLKTVPTAEPSLAGQVASRLRPGFEQQGAVVQKERVTVYTYRPETPA